MNETGLSLQQDVCRHIKQWEEGARCLNGVQR